jgi:hypothetical protein
LGLVFWVMMLHCCVGCYQCFGGTYNLYLEAILKLEVMRSVEMLLMHISNLTNFKFYLYKKKIN